MTIYDYAVLAVAALCVGCLFAGLIIEMMKRRFPVRRAES